MNNEYKYDGIKMYFLELVALISHLLMSYDGWGFNKDNIRSVSGVNVRFCRF